MSLPWDMAISEAIGKAIPNEFSKMSPVLKYIPYIGQIFQILGSIDAGTTTASDVYDAKREQGFSEGQSRMATLSPVIQQTLGSYMGGSNPGSYGSGGDVNRNWADYVGMIGNVYGNLGGTGQGFTGKISPTGLMGNATNIYGVNSGNENIANVGQNIDTTNKILRLLNKQNPNWDAIVEAFNKIYGKDKSVNYQIQNQPIIRI